jgi:hypothetical protein
MPLSDGAQELRKIIAQEHVPAPRQSATEYAALGYADAIPDSLPYFVMTATARQQAHEVSARMRIGGDPERPPLQGKRVIGWYGPPGTGKDTLAREFAASLHMPFFEFDLGQGYDLLELVGGTGLRAEHGATETVAIEGPLTAAARIGSIVAINEVVNVDGVQLSILHAMVQDRKIMLPSAEPSRDDATPKASRTHRALPVHPDTFFVFTWNPDPRDPDRQMPPPALLDRLRARRYDADNEKDEAQKLAAMLSYTLDKHVSVEAVRDDVRLIRELRRAYENGGLARCPYMRTLEDFALTRQLLGKPAALEVLGNLCDQDPQEFRHQRDDVLRRHFEPIFGWLDA